MTATAPFDGSEKAASSEKIAAARKRRRMLAVINRHSRSGGQAAGIAIARLNAAGVDLTVTSPQSPTEVTPWIEAHADEGEAVIIAGGDGSLNAVAPALLKTGLPLGILPTGTANDLARTLGIPTDIERASDVIAAGHRHAIDIGEVTVRSTPAAFRRAIAIPAA